jgi:hypothetical protein
MSLPPFMRKQMELEQKQKEEVDFVLPTAKHTIPPPHLEMTACLEIASTTS